ncbi:Crp/Fnr family transcriptional regulator [Sulfurospirillum sp. 1612]|uniref:Crp/Fnr family transcriptional regulator n=1 Tax=Sulfurospirillum sp. 1612 TaxID=3094835 RepID=UPI002F9223A6
MAKQKELQLFQGFDDAFKNEINACAKIVHFKKGDIPYFADDLMQHFYSIIDGKIKAYQLNLDTLREQTFFIYRRGDMLDTIILLDQTSHPLMYEALTPTQALQFPIEKVREWIDTKPEFNKKFFPYIASQMRHTESLASDLSLLDTTQRLIKLLLENMNPDNNFKHNLLHNLSNTEIANLIGTVRQVIERHLKAFERQNILSAERKNITIKDLTKLLKKITQLQLK